MERWNDHAHGARFIPTVFSTFNQEKAAAAVAIKEGGLNRETGLEKCGSPKVDERQYTAILLLLLYAV